MLHEAPRSERLVKAAKSTDDGIVQVERALRLYVEGHVGAALIALHACAEKREHSLSAEAAIGAIHLDAGAFGPAVDAFLRALRAPVGTNAQRIAVLRQLVAAQSKWSQTHRRGMAAAA